VAQSLVAFREIKMRQFYSAVIFLIFIAIVTPAYCQNAVYRLSSDVTPTIYDLSLRVDTYAFNGNVTIDVRINRATTQIELHQLALTVEPKVIVTSSDNVTEALHWYNNQTQKMTILVGRTLRANTNHQITLSFRGTIDSDMKGLYQSSYYNGTVKYDLICVCVCLML
jgi:aminopeptidase N